MRIKIFLYHRISPEFNSLWQPIHPRLFEKQIKHIKKKYEVVQLESHLMNSGKGKKKSKYAAIVFDDGYRDFYEHALPILKKYNIPTSMYVVTQSIDQGEYIWTYKVDYLFLNTKKTMFSLELPFEGTKNIKWKDHKEMLDFAKRFKIFLKDQSYNTQQIYLKSVFEEFNDVVLDKNLYLTWEQLQEISSANVYIGSHTHTHPMLASIKADELVFEEMVNSKKMLHENIGCSPVSISYPIGSYSEKVKKLAQKAGYKIGLAVNQIEYDSNFHDVFEIPRIEMYNEPMFKMKLRHLGIINLIKKLLNR